MTKPLRDSAENRQTAQHSATNREPLRTVVPPMLLKCGWSTKDKPKKGVWVGRSGIRTIGHIDHGAPYGPDRWIMLYMAAKAATHGQRFLGTLQEITDTFELPWSRTATLARLRRVVSCSIEQGERYDEISPRINLVERFRTQGERFEIIVTAEFLAEVRDGPVYDVNIAVQFGKSYGALDVYLWGIWALHASAQGMRVPELGRILSLPDATFKAYQRLRAHLDRILEVDPMFPFAWNNERHTLVIWYHPKKYPPTAPRQYPRIDAAPAQPEGQPTPAQPSAATPAQHSPATPARPGPISAPRGIRYVRPRPDPAAPARSNSPARTRPRRRTDAAPRAGSERSRPTSTARPRPPLPKPWEFLIPLASSIEQQAKVQRTLLEGFRQLQEQLTKPTPAPPTLPTKPTPRQPPKPKAAAPTKASSTKSKPRQPRKPKAVTKAPSIKPTRRHDKKKG